MIQLIENTNNAWLQGVYFEDINALVSSKDKAWLVVCFYHLYFSTEESATAYCKSRGIPTNIVQRK